jgi:hypothetical protein
MKLWLTTTFLFITISVSFAQSGTRDSLILSAEQNDRWLKGLETSLIHDQVKMIRERVFADTAIFVREVFADRISIDYSHEKRIEGVCKPLLVFETRPAYIGNKTSRASIEKLAKLITTANVKTVTVMKGAKAQAIYGSRAMCGVVILGLKNYEVIAEVEKIKLD